MIDQIVPEPFGGAASHIHQVVEKMDQMLRKALVETMKKKDNQLIQERYDRFRHLGDTSWKMSR